MMYNRIIIAGFGGQGILSAGRLLAYSGMLENRNVSWLPSYGPEMRGGTANCHVIISDEEIGSPILNDADVLIAMNKPSLDKFAYIVIKSGIVIVDGSLVNYDCPRSDIRYYNVPASGIADEMGNMTYANIVLLGKLVGLTGIIKKSSFEKALYDILPKKYHHMIPDEIKAFQKGADYRDPFDNLDMI
jgi:2-oxoglutarate ferredoxin oxidoreductase subunit gamma